MINKSDKLIIGILFLVLVSAFLILIHYKGY